MHRPFDFGCCVLVCQKSRSLPSSALLRTANRATEGSAWFQVRIELVRVPRPDVRVQRRVAVIAAMARGIHTAIRLLRVDHGFLNVTTMLTAPFRAIVLLGKQRRACCISTHCHVHRDDISLAQRNSILVVVEAMFITVLLQALAWPRLIAKVEELWTYLSAVAIERPLRSIDQTLSVLLVIHA